LALLYQFLFIIINIINIVIYKLTVEKKTYLLYIIKHNTTYFNNKFKKFTNLPNIKADIKTICKIMRRKYLNEK